MPKIGVLRRLLLMTALEASGASLVGARLDFRGADQIISEKQKQKARMRAGWKGR
ncbi:hypothetical protein D3C87_2013620 [compost metagenome]